jgi:hypothetical protein
VLYSWSEPSVNKDQRYGTAAVDHVFQAESQNFGHQHQADKEGNKVLVPDFHVQCQKNIEKR